MTSPNVLRLAQPYEYRPLRSGPNNIRLLQIMPGSGNADICCQVFQYTLRVEKTFGLYEALSYVWGDAADPQQIWVKNAEDTHYLKFNITKNLYTALHRLRDADLPRTVWIDAVCINQADLAERASQVQIMARIYAYAVSVTVWLGEEADDSSIVLDLLRDIVASDLKYSHDRKLASASIAPAADAILALWNRSWFRRAWVVQEAAVARVVSVACGDAEITGAIFASAMDLAFSLLRDKFEKHESVPAVLIFMNQSSGAFPLLQKLADLHTSSAIPSFNVLPLGDLLRLFQKKEATDKRDKIYALLGLSSDNHVSPNLRPDYTKSWATLFKEVIVHVLGSSPFITTWENRERAVISEVGSVLGTVYPGLTDSLAVVSPIFGHAPDIGYIWRASWEVPHDAGSIHEGDILVFFQNARRPSVIRPCGDHFDIVMISLPPPPVVIVTHSKRMERVKERQVRWDAFASGARRSTRQFNLVWDWEADSYHDCKAHAALLDSCEQPTFSGVVRSFHTARVLDDVLDTVSLTKLIKDLPDFSDIGPKEKYFCLLSHVSVHRDHYFLMKQYFASLQWCLWAIRAPINSDYLLDYWHYAGPVPSDLFDIVHLAESKTAQVARLNPGYRYTRMHDEVWQETLYPLIFGEIAPRLLKDGDRDGMISPHNGRYLLRLVLASQTSFEAPSETVLQRIFLDPVLADKSHYVFMMLLEHQSTTLDMDFCINLATSQSDLEPYFSFFAFWFAELAHDPVASYFFLSSLLQLNYGRDFLRRLWLEVLEPRTKILTYLLRNPLMCQIEMTLWLDQCCPQNSILRYLSDYLEPNEYHWDLETHVGFCDATRRYTAEELAVWIQGRLLLSIEQHERRRRRAGVRSGRNRSGIPGRHLSQPEVIQYFSF